MTRQNRIAVLAAEHAMSVSELARRADVQPHNLRRYTRQEAQPRLELAEKIAAALGVSVNEVLGTQIENGPTQVAPGRKLPVYGSAQGGAGFDITDVSSPIDFMNCPTDLMNSPDAYAVMVSGESMEPRFRAGETLLVQPGVPVRPGDDIVIQLERDDRIEALVKRFERRKNGDVICSQFNPERELEFESETILNIHKVVGSRLY